jgi:hypothetical protein
MATLRQPYPTVKLARNVAKALLDAIAGAIPTQTFVDHTVSELDDEEMEVTTPYPLRNDLNGSICLPSSLTSCSACHTCITLP